MSKRQQQKTEPEDAMAYAQSSAAPIDPICTDGEEKLRIRIHSAAPTARNLVYLPGIHGDWTMLGAFRARLGNSIRLIELTYPRTTQWTLEDYGKAIRAGLLEHGIENAWLLGESFGSQVLWELVRQEETRWQGLILAGGFVHYPFEPFLRIAQWMMPRIPVEALQGLLPMYIHYSRIRHRNLPEAEQGAREFVARRTEADMNAAIHRLELIRGSDPRALAKSVKIPVHHLYGVIDPIVPWVPVALWLDQHCPTLRGSRRILACDHTVLATAAEASAEQIRQWMA